MRDEPITADGIIDEWLSQPKPGDRVWYRQANTRRAWDISGDFKTPDKLINSPRARRIGHLHYTVVAFSGRVLEYKIAADKPAR